MGIKGCKGMRMFLSFFCHEKILFLSYSWVKIFLLFLDSQDKLN